MSALEKKLEAAARTFLDGVLAAVAEARVADLVALKQEELAPTPKKAARRAPVRRVKRAAAPKPATAPLLFGGRRGADEEE